MVMEDQPVEVHSSSIVQEVDGTFSASIDDKPAENVATLEAAREIVGDVVAPVGYVEETKSEGVIEPEWKHGVVGTSVVHLFGDGSPFASIHAYKHGVVTILEFVYSDKSSDYIKFASNSGLEVGGTGEMGTGTKLEL